MATSKPEAQTEQAKDEQPAPATDVAHRIDMNDPGKTVEEAVAENLGN
jgi:hypothetical protein